MPRTTGCPIHVAFATGFIVHAIPFAAVILFFGSRTNDRQHLLLMSAIFGAVGGFTGGAIASLIAAINRWFLVLGCLFNLLAYTLLAVSVTIVSGMILIGLGPVIIAIGVPCGILTGALVCACSRRTVATMPPDDMIK